MKKQDIPFAAISAALYAAACMLMYYTESKLFELGYARRFRCLLYAFPCFLL